MPLQVGDTATLTKTITDDDIRAFAMLTGDTNPLHFSDEYAKHTRFGRRIAHGMICASLFSSLLANQLPGPGTVYLKQQVQFTAPVFPGDTVTARVTVMSIREDKPLVMLSTVAEKADGTVVIKGEAVVLVSP